MLRKADVLAAGEDRFRDPAFTRDRVTVHTTVHTTSGTSGQILEAWHDPADYAHDRACNTRRFAAAGGRHRPRHRRRVPRAAGRRRPDPERGGVGKLTAMAHLDRPSQPAPAGPCCGDGLIGDLL
jgi:hypothetical protein